MIVNRRLRETMLDNGIVQYPNPRGSQVSSPEGDDTFSIVVSPSESDQATIHPLLAHRPLRETMLDPLSSIVSRKRESSIVSQRGRYGWLKCSIALGRGPDDQSLPY